MEHHELQVHCPHASCRGVVAVGDDGVARCRTCRTELGIWGHTPGRWATPPADPRDWNIQTVPLRRTWLRPALAAALCLGAVGIWYANREASPRPAAALDGAALLAAVRSGELPANISLPDVYRDWTLLRERPEVVSTTSSDLFKQWMQLGDQERVEILTTVSWSADPTWLTVFLAEIAYFGMAHERDPAIAEFVRSAVHATSFRIAPLAIFLLDHIERVCPHDLVRQRAREDADTIRLRLGTLGR